MHHYYKNGLSRTTGPESEAPGSIPLGATCYSAKVTTVCIDTDSNMFPMENRLDPALLHQ